MAARRRSRDFSASLASRRAKGIACEPPNPELQPLVGEVRALLREVDASRRNMERGAIWNPDMLRSVLRNELAGDEVLLVANREPYIHMHKGDGIVIRVERL